MSRFGGSTIKCPRCNKSVYDAESVIGGGKSYHPQCFTCATCNTRLSSTTLTERNETLYCSTCYAKAFGPKGFNVGNSSVHTGISVADAPATVTVPAVTVAVPVPIAATATVPPAATTSLPVSRNPFRTSAPASVVVSGDTCRGCSKRVYAAESVSGIGGRQYHSGCFKCNECKKALSQGQWMQHGDDEFCNACHLTKFGSKGYGFGGGAAGPMART